MKSSLVSIKVVIKGEDGERANVASEAFRVDVVHFEDVSPQTFFMPETFSAMKTLLSFFPIAVNSL